MYKSASTYFAFAGVTTFIGGLIHLSMIIGGSSWYRFFGAPESIAQMAGAGSLYPAFVCVFIACVLFTWSLYAFSGARVIAKLPFLRIILISISVALIIRGISFIPFMLISPEIFQRITNCQSVNAFLIITSAICLIVGLAYAVGIKKSWSSLKVNG
jgi:hypothetical protein